MSPDSANHRPPGGPERRPRRDRRHLLSWLGLGFDRFTGSRRSVSIGRPPRRSALDHHGSTSARPAGHRHRRGGLLLIIALVCATAGIVRTNEHASAGPGPLDAAHQFGAPIWSGDLRGNVTTIGNVVTTCRPGSTADPSFGDHVGTCEEVLSGAIGGDDSDPTRRFPANNEFDMIHVDVDDDPATHNSSTARLNLVPGAEVVWAGLHWHGLLDSRSGGVRHERWNPPVDPEQRFRVHARAPDGSSHTVEADDRWETPPIASDGAGHRSYAGSADVTELVRNGGAGLWTIGNVQTCTGPSLALGCIGGWSLTVVYAAEDEPARNVNVWHGWAVAHDQPGGTLDVTADGIVPPPAGGVAELGIVAADGDRGRGPESVRHRTASHPDWTPLRSPVRPLHSDDPDEFFNSTIDTFGELRSDRDAVPNDASNLGLDIAIVGDIPIAGDDGGIQFRVDTTTRRDAVYAQVLHSSIPLFEPEIAVTKTASVDVADPGEVITWSVEVANVGIEPIRDTRVIDVLPPELEFVPGSIRYEEGGPPDLLGAKSDGPDDEARWSADDRTLHLHLGSGANADSGGTMGVATAADGSDRVVIRFDTVWHGEPGSDVVNEARASGFGRELAEDPFGPITTEDHDEDRVLGRLLPLLVQDKTVDDEAAHPGDRRTFTVSVHNAGAGVAAAGTTVVDDLPDGLTVTEIGAGGVHDPEERRITWTDLPALEPGDAWAAEVVVDVDEGRWDERFVNRVLIEPPNDDPVDVEHPCEDDPTRSCAEVHTPRTGWQQDKRVAGNTPDTVEPGNEVTFELHVHNTGEVAATPVAVDRLPDGLAFVSASHDGEHDPEDGRITWTALDEIDAGDDLVLTVVTRVEEPTDADPGTLVNRFLVEPPTDHPDPEVGHPCEDDPAWSCAEVRRPEPEPPTSAPPPATTPPRPVETPPARTAGPPSSLPRTGHDPFGLLLLGLAATSGGWSLLLLTRRRPLLG